MKIVAQYRMATIFNNVLSSGDIDYLINHPNTLANKSRFSIELTDSIRNALTPLGLDLSHNIPLRWVYGDTAPHVDTGSAPFTKTFLLYLTDSPGSFIVGNQAYPIRANTAFVFNEGVSHKTIGTRPRLMIGPMSERADPVGAASGITYYRNENDANAFNNSIGFSSYMISTVDGFSRWRIASNSAGLSPIGNIYNDGDSLNPLQGDGSTAYYALYPVLGTPFVSGSPQIQAAANTVYQYKADFDAAAAAAGSNKVYTFKTDWERMQYKLGQFGLYSRGLAPG